MGAERELQARQLAKVHRPSWRKTSFLARLEPEALDALVAGRQGMRLTAGERLMSEDEAADSVFLLLDAVVKIAVRLDRGSALLAVRVGGDIVGEMAVADGGSRSATVTVGRDGDVVKVPSGEFMAVMGRYPAAGQLLSAELSRRLRASDRRWADFTACKVDVRVARVLVELAESHGQPEPGRPSMLVLRIGLTQRELATLVGAGEAAVADALKKLDNQQVITRGYREVTIRNVELLRKAANWGYSA
jgi:CRP/FNR family transcriptional regulator, cyclic AMP receptor protein